MFILFFEQNNIFKFSTILSIYLLKPINYCYYINICFVLKWFFTFLLHLFVLHPLYIQCKYTITILTIFCPNVLFFSLSLFIFFFFFVVIKFIHTKFPMSTSNPNYYGNCKYDLSNCQVMQLHVVIDQALVFQQISHF